jgi:hypothetical protein
VGRADVISPHDGGAVVSRPRREVLLNLFRTPARRGGSRVDKTRRSCVTCTATRPLCAFYGRAVGASQLLLSSRAVR